MKNRNLNRNTVARPGRALGVAMLLVVGLLLPARAADVRVSASVSPPQIGLDETAQLSVTVQGSESNAPQLPPVDGLRFTPVGQSTSFQSINGATSASVSYLYQVTAARAGTFTIPSIRTGGGASQPVRLEVLKSHVAGPRALGRGLPPPNFNAPDLGATAQTPDDQGRMAFLRVVTPQDKLYVGELMPVQIKAYFRRGMRAGLDGLPVLSSDAFTLSKLGDDPEQAEEIVNNTPYTVLTWSAALSAVKAGDHSLSLELPVRVRVKERTGNSRPRDPFGLFSNDPFFDDALFNDFFGRVTEKQLKLQSSPAMVQVASVPASGRPADFSGAVGQFDVETEVAPRSATAGDPLTLTLTVSGEGNFDRVSSGGLPDSAMWKTYQPSTTFEPADSVGLAGRKVFTQAIVPEQSGRVEVPSLAFSYLDPDTGEYITRHSKPIPIDVAPSTGTPAVAAGTPPAASLPGGRVAPGVAPPAGLLPNAVASAPTVASLRPMVLKPVFVLLGITGLAGFGAGLLLVQRRDRRAASPDFVRQQADASALRNNLARMDQAADAGDETAFFASARSALQQQLAQVWNIKPQAVTLAEIKARLADAGESICSVFRAADQSAYASHSVSRADLQEWRDQVRMQLKELKAL